MKYAGDILPLTRDLKGPVVAKPADIPPDEKVRSIIFEWEKDYADYITRRNILASNLKAAYTIIWGQCSETMRAKVKSSTEYTAKSAICDCEWLLKTIRGVTLKFDGQRKIHRSISDAHGAYHSYRPAPDVTLAVYLEEFSALVDTIEHYGGCIGHDTALTDFEPSASTAEEKQKGARDKLLAMDFLKKAPRGRFGGLLTDLDNLFSRGADQYPKDLAEAHSLLVNYQPPRSGYQKPPPVPDDNDDTPAGSELSFAQLGAVVPGSDGATHAHIQCFACKSKGHYANMCPTDKDVQLLQCGKSPGTDDDGDFTFTSINTNVAIPKTWVLLDSQSTISVFCNRDLLTRIRPCVKPLLVHTNGGHQISNYVGEVRNFGTVWFNEDSLANILSLAEVRKNITSPWTLPSTLPCAFIVPTALSCVSPNTSLDYTFMTQQHLKTIAPMLPATLLF